VAETKEQQTTARTQGKLIAIPPDEVWTAWVIQTTDDEKLADGIESGDEEKDAANAHHLAHCWNTHDELVDALGIFADGAEIGKEWNDKKDDELITVAMTAGELRHILKLYAAAQEPTS